MENQFQYENPFEPPEASASPLVGSPPLKTNKLAYRSLGLSLLLKGILFFVFCALVPIAFMSSDLGPHFSWLCTPFLFLEIAVLVLAFKALKEPGEGRWAAFVSIFLCVGTLLFLLWVFIASFLYL